VAVPLAVGVEAWLHRDDVVSAAHLVAGASLRWMGPAALAIGGVYLCRAAVYRLPLRLFGYRTSLAFLWKTALVATSLHQLIPTGGASGFAFLTWAMQQRGVKAGEASLIALIDTLSYAAAAGTLVVASLLYLLLAGGPQPSRLAFGFVPGIGLLLAAIWIYRLQRHRRRLERRATRWKDRVAGWLGVRWSDEPLRRFLDQYYDGRRVIAARPRAFWRMVGLQYVAVVCDAAALYLAFLALSLTPEPATVLMGFVLAISGMAIAAAPGGGGSFEAILAGFFTSHGVPAAQAIAAALLYRVVAFWLPVLATLGVLASLRRRRREIRPVGRRRPG